MCSLDARSNAQIVECDSVKWGQQDAHPGRPGGTVVKEENTCKVPSRGIQCQLLTPSLVSHPLVGLVTSLKDRSEHMAPLSGSFRGCPLINSNFLSLDS